MYPAIRSLARHAARAIVLAASIGPASIARAEGPSAPVSAVSPESALLSRARGTIADIRAFEHLNQQIVQLCREPVKGSYADWRDDFHEDLERTRVLEKVLGAPPASVAAAADRTTEQTLKPFRDSGEQELYSRCLRWGTALIQHEARLRADIAAKFAFLKANEAGIRAALARPAGAP